MSYIQQGSGAVGTGTVTSVGLTVNSTSPSGVFTVTGSPVIAAGTLNVNLAGTSGGIPYFSSGTVLSSSAALTANQIVLGGGAATTPASLGSLGTTTTVLHGNAAGAPTFGAVDLTADVTGVLPPANGGVALSNATNLGGCFVGIDCGWGTLANAAGQICTAANVVNAFQFIQKYTQTFTKMAIKVTTTFGAASHIGMGIYNSAGSLITNATTGALDGTSTAAVQVATVTAVTLVPGIYWLGVATDGSGATTGRTVGLIIPTANAVLTQFTNSAQGNKVITGATASAGGVPPATLGVLSSNTTVTALPGLWIEP